MPTLATLPIRNQFEVLRRFAPKGDNPFFGFPSTVLVLPRTVVVDDPLIFHADTHEPVPMPLISIDLRRDPRVRFTQPKATVKTEPRDKRPWLQAHPVGNIGAAVRLTSEGVRRLSALADIMETQGVLPPLPMVIE